MREHHNRAAIPDNYPGVNEVSIILGNGGPDTNFQRFSLPVLGLDLQR